MVLSLKPSNKPIIERHDEEYLFTFKEAMTYLRISRSTLHRLMQSSQVTGYKVGNGWRFYRRDLRSCIQTPPLSDGREAPSEVHAGPVAQEVEGDR
jgi:excisionase family DNA binding protein